MQPSAVVIEDKERTCDSLLMCIVTVLSHGLRSGGGVGDVLRKPSKEVQSNSNNTMKKKDLIYPIEGVKQLLLLHAPLPQKCSAEVDVMSLLRSVSAHLWFRYRIPCCAHNNHKLFCYSDINSIKRLCAS